MKTRVTWFISPCVLLGTVDWPVTYGMTGQLPELVVLLAAPGID
jgi:hypothetical protein